MRRTVYLLCLAATLTVFGMSSQASADYYRDRDVDNTRIYGGLGLGFGGDLEIGNDEYDLGTSIGGQFGADFILARFFALGAEARITGFELEGTSSRSRFIDLVAKPRLRFPLSGRAEIYATVPIGLTIPRLGDFDNDGADEKLGWNVGVGAGLTFFLTNSFGLNVEPIYLIHKFGAEVGDDDADATAKQFAILLNAVIAL